MERPVQHRRARQYRAERVLLVGRRGRHALLEQRARRRRGQLRRLRARWVDGRFGEPENVGTGVNGSGAEIDNYVAPDQSFVVFAGYGRSDGPGRGDLYISYREADGTSGPASLLGHGINSAAREYCPIGSPDGEYFYWTSKRGFADEPLDRALTTRQLRETLSGPRFSWSRPAGALRWLATALTRSPRAPCPSPWCATYACS